MAKLTELLAIPIGLFVVKQITDRIQDEPNAKEIVPKSKPTVIDPKPLIKNGFVTGPAGPSLSDFGLLKDVIKISPEQLKAFKAGLPKILTEGALERARKGFGL